MGLVPIPGLYPVPGVDIGGSRDHSPRFYAALKTVPASAPGHEIKSYALCL